MQTCWTSAITVHPLAEELVAHRRLRLLAPDDEIRRCLRKCSGNREKPGIVYIQQVIGSSNLFKVGMTVDQPPINFDSWTLDTYGPIHFAVNEDYQQINWHVDVRGNHASLIRERLRDLVCKIKGFFPCDISLS